MASNNGILESKLWAAVETTIKDILDQLPPAYSKDLHDTKCSMTYQHVYDNYYGAGRSVYQAI